MVKTRSHRDRGAMDYCEDSDESDSAENDEAHRSKAGGLVKRKTTGEMWRHVNLICKEREMKNTRNKRVCKLASAKTVKCPDQKTAPLKGSVAEIANKQCQTMNGQTELRAAQFGHGIKNAIVADETQICTQQIPGQMPQVKRPLWSNCHVCKAVVLIPFGATHKQLVQIGAQHIEKHHHDLLNPPVATPNKKLILKLLPELDYENMLVLPPLLSDACTPLDLSDHTCTFCGKKVENMSDETDDDCELINHINEHVNQTGGLLASELFWQVFPKTGPNQNQQQDDCEKDMKIEVL